MAGLFNILKVTVSEDKICAHVLVNPGMPLMTSEDIEATARVYYLVPAIAKHLCLGDSGREFQDCMGQTELCHLLEHVTVELMNETGLAGSISCGRTRVSEHDARVFEVELSCPGDALAIGFSETMYAAIRNENITAIIVNNGIYGMTGGQMAPTTLPHQKTATSPKGKDPAKYGTLNVVDVLGKMDIAYLARGELVGPAGMNNCKKLIRKAFEHQLNGDGFSLVELLSPCPTNLNMPPVKAREHVPTEMTKNFTIGEYIDKKGGNQA